MCMCNNNNNIINNLYCLLSDISYLCHLSIYKQFVYKEAYKGCL